MDTGQVKTLLLLGALHLTLTAAPGVASVLEAARRGVRDVATLLAIGLVASGSAAMLAFWAYFASHGLGVVISYGILAASVVVACLNALRLRRRFPWGRLGTPLGLWILATLFLLLLGFLHGGTERPLEMAATRFSHPLPNDNWLPKYFSDWFFNFGHSGRPPPDGDWLSSDRPPLQIGYVLAQRPIGWSTLGLNYQVLGVALQQLWIIGLWALLDAARMRASTRAMIVVTVLVSDVAIVHGFFIWPKLIGVGFLLAAAAFVLTDRWVTGRRRPGVAVLVGSLLALALLCHGSSVFGVIPLALVAMIRGLPSWRWIGAGLVAGAVLYVPWAAYQRYFDPPGNRLQKLMLAGVTHVDERTVVEAIIDSYSNTGFGGAIDNKLRNVNAISGGAQGVKDVAHAIELAGSGDFDKAVRTARGVRFFSLLQALGVFVAAPFVLLVLRIRGRTRDPADWRFGLRCLSFVLLACIAWVILGFGNDQSLTFIHQGSLAVPVLALAGCVAGLGAAMPRLAGIFVGVNVLMVLALYAPSLDPPPATRFSYVAAAAAVASLSGFVITAFRSSRSLPLTVATVANDTGKPKSP